MAISTTQTDEPMGTGEILLAYQVGMNALKRVCGRRLFAAGFPFTRRAST